VHEGRRVVPRADRRGTSDARGLLDGLGEPRVLGRRDDDADDPTVAIDERAAAGAVGERAGDHETRSVAVEAQRAPHERRAHSLSSQSIAGARDVEGAERLTITQGRRVAGGHRAPRRRSVEIEDGDVGATVVDLVPPGRADAGPLVEHDLVVTVAVARGDELGPDAGEVDHRGGARRQVALDAQRGRVTLPKALVRQRSPHGRLAVAPGGGLSREREDGGGDEGQRA
jgi:hypothetical protein